MTFRGLTAFVLLLAVSISAFGQVFTRINPQNAVGLFNSQAEWIDFDNDGDLDFLITGAASTNELRTLLYENTGNDIFRQAVNPFNILPQYSESQISFLSTNTDDRIDIMLMGRRIGDPATTRRLSMLENRTSGFIDVATLPDFEKADGNGTTATGDVNNDGTLDIFVSGISGFSNGEPIVNAFIYLNKNGIYTKGSSSFRGLYLASSKLVDIDNDGDLDLITCGRNNTAPFQNSQLYLNDGSGSFSLLPTQLKPLQNPSIDLADYDADNDLDILLTGFDESMKRTSKLYKNDNNSFSEIPVANLSRTVSGNATWGDYDNDGDYDILITGDSFVAPLKLAIFQNNGTGQFFEINDSSFEIVESGSSVWGDYDNDGDLDILVIGSSNPNTTLYVLKNNTTKKNNKSNKPVGIQLTKLSTNSARLNWNATLDDLTPTSSISYNLSIQKTFTGEVLMPSFSDRVTGKRRIAKAGNVWLNKSWVIKDLENGTYSIRVQSIDGAFLGSEWSDEKRFYAGLPNNPSGLALAFEGGKIKLSWADNSINEEYFVIERRINGGAFFKIDSVAANTSMFSESYSGSDVYEYRVNAVNPNQRSSYTNIVQTTIDPPSNLGFAYENGNIRLNWKDNSYSEKYFVVERRSTGSFLKIDSVNANSATFLFGTQPIGIYSYRINATNSKQRSPYSNTIDILVTGIDLTEKDIGVYPNPASNILRLRTGKTSKQSVQVNIYDINGSNIIVHSASTEKNGELTIDVSTLPAGSYLVSLRSTPEGGVRLFRFSKK